MILFESKRMIRFDKGLNSVINVIELENSLFQLTNMTGVKSLIGVINEWIVEIWFKKKMGMLLKNEKWFL